MLELVTLCVPCVGLIILGLIILVLAWPNRKKITQINATTNGINVYFYHKENEPHNK